MRKFHAKVMVEAYVWLEAETSDQAAFIAANIDNIKTGVTLSSFCSDSEVGHAETIELYELTNTPTGAVKMQMNIRNQ